jgi:hypothetical protein
MIRERIFRTNLGMLAFASVLSLAAAGVETRPRVACDIQFDLTLKILNFDRNLRLRVGEELMIGIVYDNDSPASAQVKMEMERAIEDSAFKSVDRIPIRKIVLDISRSTNWTVDLAKSGVDLVYLTPLREQALIRMLGICRKMKLTSVASLPEYPARGATIGFEPPGGKPVIVINLRTAAAEGADFSSRLLSVAKVIR